MVNAVPRCPIGRRSLLIPVHPWQIRLPGQEPMLRWFEMVGSRRHSDRRLPALLRRVVPCLSHIVIHSRRPTAQRRPHLLLRTVRAVPTSRSAFNPAR
ncbi:unnamed protein product [Urochloa humidicola]